MSSTGTAALQKESKNNTTETSVYVGNLDDRCTEALLWELFIQVGPVNNVHIPRDRVTQIHQGFGFVELASPDDADYAARILNGIKLFGRILKVNRTQSGAVAQLDVGANIFIGNLDSGVDEKMLVETFSVFGRVLEAKVGRDFETNMPKGFGFVNFDCFEASDAAIEAMSGQYLGNKPISVTYAYKKDGHGERHGTPAERLYAAELRKQTIAAANAPQ